MADITGEFDGYTYKGNWIRVADKAIHWSARVRGPSGTTCGTPGGTIRHQDITDEQIDSSVRQAIDISIRDSVGVDREEDD